MKTIINTLKAIILIVFIIILYQEQVLGGKPTDKKTIRGCRLQYWHQGLHWDRSCICQ